ncbi:MAG: acyltransferase [Planctomycetota bacterium]
MRYRCHIRMADGFQWQTRSATGNSGNGMNYSQEELESLGLRHLGKEVQVHRSAMIYNAAKISIGDYSRIDCQTLLSAGEEGIDIGKCVHIAAGCFLFGGGGNICLEDYSGLSSRVTIYSATDDYTEGYMTNPTVPDAVRKVTRGPVCLRKHAIVGAGSVILPNVELRQAAAVGALTLVNKDVGEFEILVSRSAGSRVVGQRGRHLLDLEKSLTE